MTVIQTYLRILDIQPFEIEFFSKSDISGTHHNRGTLIETISVRGVEEASGLGRVMDTAVSRVREIESAIRKSRLIIGISGSHPRRIVDQLACIMPFTLDGAPGTVMFGFHTLSKLPAR